jgi:hypothetical protein
MIEPSIRKLLTSAGTLTPILGDRVFLGNAPQDERRARVVLNVLSKTFPHCHDGRAGYQTGTIQVACLAPTYQHAHELADAVRLRLDMYEGFGVTPQVEILHLEIEDAEDIEREPFDGQGEATYGVAMPCRFILEDNT